MKILIIGGLGYTGSVLTNQLLNSKNHVTTIDTAWFGDQVKAHKNLKKIKADIRNLKEISFK
jgi:UDP-glucose 4-epimerase